MLRLNTIKYWKHLHLPNKYRKDIHVKLKSSLTTMIFSKIEIFTQKRSRISNSPDNGINKVTLHFMVTVPDFRNALVVYMFFSSLCVVPHFMAVSAITHRPVAILTCTFNTETCAHCYCIA